MNSENPLVLIVDDNPQNIQFLGNLLTTKSYEIGIAQNGKDALAFVEAYLPDLILLDIMMPEMDGYEVCAALKNDRTLSHIPVIFLSAKSETEDIVRGFKLGAVDYVSKPFITDELMSRVDAHLELGRLRNLIPICAHCGQVRDEEGFWRKIEAYIESHTKARFSHGVCEKCATELYKDTKWFRRKSSQS